MQKNNKSFGFYVVAAIALLGIGAVIGILSWQALRAGDGEPSEEISAPTLDVNAVPTFSQSQAAVFATENAQLRAENEALAATADAALALAEEQGAMVETAQAAAMEVKEQETPVPTITPTEIPPTEEPEAISLGRVRYAIITTESEARFNIDETLRGNDIVVVGVTNEIAGEVVVDFDSPIASQVGMIRINVRTLATDNDFRNRALRSDILESAQDQYEFAEFTPTSLDGLPDSAAIGDVVEFQITGDLNLHGVTRTLTFDAQVTLVSEERLEGYASTTVQYNDFGITIPMPPTVSFIGDDVLMELDFVALAVEE